MAEGWSGIAHAPERGRYRFACPERNCYRALDFKTLEEAERDRDNHGCPNIGGPTKVSWSVGKTLVEQMWDKLDETMEQVMVEQLAEAKVRARAIAECIVIFMEIYFPTTDDVAKEAVRRYNAKKNGDSEYETAGLNSRRYEAAQREAVKHGQSAPTRTPDGKPVIDVARVPEQDRTAIKQALDLGMFSVPELSKIYKLKDEVIEAIRNS